MRSIDSSRTSAHKAAADILCILPLFRKKLMRMDFLGAHEGLPMSHIYVLATLKRDGAVSVSDISNRFHIAKSNITPLIDHLVKMDYVERSRSERDRRIVFVELKPAGLEKMEEIEELTAKNLTEVSKSLSKKEFQDLAHALHVLSTLLEKIETE